MAMDAHVDYMEDDRGPEAEKKEVIELNMVLGFVIEYTFDFAMVPPGNGVQRSGSPGNKQPSSKSTTCSAQ
jgi:hypothetical protein